MKNDAPLWIRTQRAGNQRLPGNYCLTAIALGASGAHDASRIRAHTFSCGQKVQRSGRILRSLFQKGDQAAHDLLDFLPGGRNQCVVQLYGEDDQHDLRKGQMCIRDRMSWKQA